MFGNHDHPIRMSGTPSLIRCPMKHFLLAEGLMADEGGPAAQTGSLAHEAIANLHRHQGETGVYDVEAATVRSGRRSSERFA